MAAHRPGRTRTTSIDPRPDLLSTTHTLAAYATLIVCTSDRTRRLTALD